MQTVIKTNSKTSKNLGNKMEKTMNDYDLHL